MVGTGSCWIRYSTGTGWVDQTLIEAAEFLTRGDIATYCIQYARYPSFLSVQKVALGRGQFRRPKG